MGTNILAPEGCRRATPPAFFVCLNVLGLSVLKQLEDLEVEEMPGQSDLQPRLCLGPWLVLDVTEKSA